MKLSACLTIHNRTPEVSKLVAESLRLPGNQPDELLIVLDRPTDEARQGVEEFYRPLPFPVRTVEIKGEPGWGSPVPAWNKAFGSVSGDHLYAFSSETVQAAGNLDKARSLVEEGPVVVFGKAECSCGPMGQEVNWGGQAPGNLLVDAAHPRPLGFLWAAPVTNVRQIGGMDKAFIDGFFYDDDDFFIRLWRTGLDFVFTDDISGIHLHHERPVLASPEGMAGIERNRAYMLGKHGTLQPWAGALRLTESRPGRTTWRHL